MRINYFSHSVETMFALSKVTEDFLMSLPTEFTKKEFEALRKVCPNHPLSLQVCRDRGFVVITRTEPATYSTLETVWIDPQGRKYNQDEMYRLGRSAVASLFNCPDYADYTKWIGMYSLPHEEVRIEHPCERNIFTVDLTKFKSFCEKNS